MSTEETQILLDDLVMLTTGINAMYELSVEWNVENLGGNEGVFGGLAQAGAGLQEDFRRNFRRMKRRRMKYIRRT